MELFKKKLTDLLFKKIYGIVQKKANGFKPYLIFAKSSILDI